MERVSWLRSGVSTVAGALSFVLESNPMSNPWKKARFTSRLDWLYRLAAKPRAGKAYPHRHCVSCSRYRACPAARGPRPSERKFVGVFVRNNRLASTGIPIFRILLAHRSVCNTVIGVLKPTAGTSAAVREHRDQFRSANCNAHVRLHGSESHDGGRPQVTYSITPQFCSFLEEFTGRHKPRISG